MNILVAGGSGFIGSALCAFLKNKGYRITVLTRSSMKKSTSLSVLHWDGKTLKTDQTFDVIINLCGQGIADKRWSQSVKNKLQQSRLVPTQAIVSFIKSCPPEHKPTLINASAIGFYPSSEQTQSEDQHAKSKGHLFSQELVFKWEQCARQASTSDAIVTVLRFGVVLGKGGGMLKKIIPSFKLGLGAIIGDQTAHLSWIHIDDLCRAVDFIMQQQHIKPAYNLTAPNACTQLAFAKSIAAACHKPCFINMPPFLVAMLFGQMGKELLLANQTIYPKQLLDAGFRFAFPDIQTAIKDII